MKRILPFIVAIALITVAFAAKGQSSDAVTNSAADAVQAKYTRAIEGRTADILRVLALDDKDKAAKVHDTVIGQYRALKAWHEENDVKLKAAARDTNAVATIRASLKTLHAEFLSRLAENLTPEQIDQVKDKMTYGKVQFTFAGYRASYPDLSEANQKKILELLKEAREDAMDGGSAEEKTAIFQKYKGRINNYLSKQGIHPEKPKVGGAPATNAPAK
jgi:hypothetical protein